MSQDSVMELLKKEYPKWLTVKEMAYKLGISTASVNTNMARIRKFNKKMMFVNVTQERQAYSYQYHKK